MTAQRTRVSRACLALREPADAAARARELLEPLAVGHADLLVVPPRRQSGAKRVESA